MGVLDKDYFYLNTYCIDCSNRKYLHALTLHVFLDHTLHSSFQWMEKKAPESSFSLFIHSSEVVCHKPLSL